MVSDHMGRERTTEIKLKTKNNIRMCKNGIVGRGFGREVLSYEMTALKRVRNYALFFLIYPGLTLSVILISEGDLRISQGLKSTINHFKSCQAAQSAPIRTGHVVCSVLFNQLKTERA